ncbi:MAG: DUF2752 domain-containing protein [Barnesiella sp.]|nr:DUF2752 domain-containing protein [Barnesiella sp.]
MIRKFDRRAIVAVVVAAVAIALLLFYALVDVDSGLMPRCPIKALTGFDCPGCGSQRMIHALLHGDFAGAWRRNPFLIVMIPVMLAALVAELWRKRFPRLNRVILSPASIAVIIAATAIWTICRNIGG